ncbi:MAG: nucleotidyltransferase family protein [Chloroflexota bacterium]
MTPTLEANTPVEQLAAWLTQQGLGPLAYRHYKQTWPQLAAPLRTDLYHSIARNGVHFAHLETIMGQFEAQVPIVLLKGVALAEEVYGGQAFRTMTDIDLWTPASHIDAAIALMGEAGFQVYAHDRRPLALQMLSNGEVKFYRTTWQTRSLVELHLSPFPGWWLVHTAAIDNEAIWERLEPVCDHRGAFQLDPADTIIHLAVHTAINHQFDLAFVRSLMDITLTAQKRNVDWQAVVKRAKEWRVAAVMYFVLDLLNTIIGLPDLEPVLNELRPPAWQRFLFGRLVKPEATLNGSDMFSSSLRLAILLLLVDRWRDRGKLIGRTLFPTASWREARYGQPTSYWKHFGYMVRQKDI